MKKTLFLAIISALLCCCTNSFMKKPISEALTAKEIQKFPSVTDENGDLAYSGEDIYEDIRYSVDELYNKPTNQLTVNETKAIALCDKITYQDCYDFYLEYEKNYRQSFEDNAKKLNIDPDKRREKDIELEDIELYGKCRNLTRQEVLNKLQNKDKYHNILFLIETTTDF